MLDGTVPALRYARSWLTREAPVIEREVLVDREGEHIPATLILPRRRATGLPGWVVLHGITRPGRFHPTMVRFARALASTPAAVLAPEVPEWTRLRLAPERSIPTIRAAVLALDARPETAPGRTGLIGFSFGAPQALIAAADPSLARHLAGVVAYGGYCDLERTLRFQFTGVHEWEGRQHRVEPDLYGRWVVGANFLTGARGFEDAGDVADALRRLAAEAGDRQLPSRDPAFDALKRELRRQVAPGRREIYDLFVPPDARPAPGEAVERLVAEMAAGQRRTTPLLDPRPFLSEVGPPVRMVHGRADSLIPFTETLRARAAFPPEADVHATITGLFAHSEGYRAPLAVRRLWQNLALLHSLRRIFRLV